MTAGKVTGAFSKEFMEGLDRKHTKTLLNMLRSTYGGRNDDLTEKDVVAIKNELAKREHVPTKAQSTLIRKMSQKAGKRLTLKQAQLMKNKENKK